jgi:signal transduction histidine kinase
MRERLRQLGGECRIESHSGQGTTVIFHLPLP